MDIIVGSSGFLGSRLSQRLPEAICLHHGTDSDVEESPVESPAEPVGRHSWDTLFFLAVYGNRYGQDDKDKIVTGNIMELLASLNMQPKSFVYISSSSVHLKIQTPYSRMKKAAEEIVQATRSACIIRPYSITGVGEQREHLIPTLIRSCLYGEAVDFVTWPHHDYIDVEDVVEAILNLSPHPGIYEVGSGRGYSNQQVLEIVEHTTGKKANVSVVDGLRPYDTVDWLCRDISARKFGWKPRKTLVDSIQEMVAHELSGTQDLGHKLQERINSYWFMLDGGKLN